MTKTYLFVKGFFYEKTKTLCVDSEGTVYSVMAKLDELTGIPPIVQRITFRFKHFYHDTPGTLAELEMVDLSHPNSPNTVYVDTMDWDRLRRKTLMDLGFPVYQEDVVPKPPSPLRRRTYIEHMIITVTDHIRMDGGRRQLLLQVGAEDTVASLMEQVQRARRYPVAMQELYIVRNAGAAAGVHTKIVVVQQLQQLYMSNAGAGAGVHTKMDKLDATLADYNVKRDSHIELHMNMEFAFQADRERRNVNVKAKEIAVPAEQQKLDDDEK